MRILIIEDDKELSKNICIYLKAECYSCDIADNYRSAIDKISGYDYDCIVLDVSLPDGNGLNILQELKDNRKNDGVIIVSAKGSLDDKVTGLRLGADDYLAKPFHLSELSARIDAVIRRRRFDGNVMLEINDLVIDTSSRNVKFENKIIDFTRKEYDLFLYLAINKNRVVSKNAIAEHLSGDNIEYFNNFDFIYAHIKNIKKKLDAYGVGDCIKSIYGIGYKLEVV